MSINNIKFHNTKILTNYKIELEYFITHKIKYLTALK
jgi:hypothetical protein